MTENKWNNLDILLMEDNTFPEWFLHQQAIARQNWESLELPKIERARFHRWPLFETEYVNEALIEKPLTYSLESVLSSSETSENQIVHAGNLTLMQSLESKWTEQGVIVMDLFEAMTQVPDLIQPYFNTVIDTMDDKITAYNMAFLNGGIFIYVPRNVEVTVPIEALLISDNRGKQAFNKRILIVVEDNSTLEYLERYQSFGEYQNSATIIVEVIAKRGAKIKYMAIDSSKGNTTYIKRYARTEDDAQINWAIGELNDGNTILDLDTYLNGRGSESQVAIVGVSSGKQQQIIDSKVVNRGHHSIGNIFQHGVILDRATLTFNGIGLIENGAKHADAQQESRVLMLSDKARGDANPILLIEEFEVTAGHAASVGQVDEQQLYYLMSRGLTKEVAEYLVIRGFLGPVILSMPSQQVQKELLDVIDYKLQSIQATEMGD